MAEASAADAGAPAVLALGAWLKNAACRLPLRAGAAPQWSALHGDLGEPQACAALQASVATLRDRGPVVAVAHDLHPDFFSSRLALQLAAEMRVPAIAVQHHHAHIAAVLAEHNAGQQSGHGITEPVLGLALDGFGLGSDGQAWGGELLWLHRAQWQRMGSLQPLALPGGDAAAREPWRMAAAALFALGRGGEIVPRFAPLVGTALADGVAQLLRQKLNCPTSSSAGRWFDAAAGALGLSGRRQDHEAQAAMLLEKHAQRAWPATSADPGPAMPGAARDASAATAPPDLPQLDLRPLLLPLFELAAQLPAPTAPTATTATTGTPAAPAQPSAATAQALDRAAAVFHRDLADQLAGWVAAAARRSAVTTVCLGGGCFANRLLSSRLTAQLNRHGLRVLQPLQLSCGDAALAFGQAWVAGQQLLDCSTTGAAATVQPAPQAQAVHPITEDHPCA